MNKLFFLLLFAPLLSFSQKVRTLEFDFPLKGISGIEVLLDNHNSMLLHVTAGRKNTLFFTDGKRKGMTEQIVSEDLSLLGYASDTSIFTAYCIRGIGGMEELWSIAVDKHSGLKRSEFKHSEVNIQSDEKIVGGYQLDDNFHLVTLNKNSSTLLIRRFNKDSKAELVSRFVLEKNLISRLKKLELVTISRSDRSSWTLLSKPAKLYPGPVEIYITLDDDNQKGTTLLTCNLKEETVKVQELNPFTGAKKQNSILVGPRAFVIAVALNRMLVTAHSIATGEEISRYTIAEGGAIPFKTSDLVKTSYNLMGKSSLSAKLPVERTVITQNDIRIILKNLYKGTPVIQLSETKGNYSVEIGSLTSIQVTGGAPMQHFAGSTNPVYFGVSQNSLLREGRIKHSFWGVLDQTKLEPVIGEQYWNRLGFHDKIDERIYGYMEYELGDVLSEASNLTTHRLIFWKNKSNNLQVVDFQ